VYIYTLISVYEQIIGAPFVLEPMLQIFFFLSVLEFKLRASLAIGTLSLESLALFCCFVIFQLGS
jgi:hypothetical protein